VLLLLLLLLALQAAVDVLRDSVLPSLTDASAQHSRLQDFPLGFETGGEGSRGADLRLKHSCPLLQTKHNN
jgi:hypothetical protein